MGCIDGEREKENFNTGGHTHYLGKYRLVFTYQMGGRISSLVSLETEKLIVGGFNPFSPWQEVLHVAQQQRV